MKTIKLAPDLELPADEASTQRYAFIGLPGMGKSNGGAVLVEGLLDHGEQVIVLDPASIWPSLRLKADGKTPAYEVVVMGGDHGDIPLAASSGKLIAEALAASTTSAVIDLADFTLGEQRRFVSDFAEAFFQAKKRNRSPVMVVLEEAHEFIPQKVGPDQTRMYGNLLRAAKIGRNYGIGWCYMDHRPQELNKAVLNLVSNLFVFGMSGKHERKAITEWLTDSGLPGSANADLDAILATLPIGRAYAWSPRWLKKIGQFQFPLKSTYDAGKTPTRGQSTVMRLGPIDVEALRTSLAAVEQQATINNPKALQQKVAQLEAELRRTNAVPVRRADDIRELETLRHEVSDLRRWKKVAAEMIESAKSWGGRMGHELRDVALRLESFHDDLAHGTGPFADSVSRLAEASALIASLDEPTPTVQITTPRRDVSNGLAKGEAKVLTAIAQYRDGVTREQLTVMTGYKRSSRDTYLQRLSAAGLIENYGSSITVTASGIKALGADFQPLPTGSFLRAHYMQTLPEGERRVLDVLVKAYPKTVDREILSKATGYKRSSRDTYLQRLGARQLVNAERGTVAASKILFE